MPIQIHKSVHGQYYTRVVAANGKTLTSSETLKQKKSAFKNAYSLIKTLGLKGQSAKIVDKTV